jgi:hypothetical protein
MRWTGEVKSSEGPRGEPLGKGRQEVLPRGVPEGSIYKWDTEVFGRKGASVETENARDVALDRRGVLKKKTWDLSLLQSRLEASEKVWRISRRELASRTVGLPIRRVSSTNWLCEIGGEMPWRGSPDSCLDLIAAWIDLLRPSAKIMKRKGERGSPCLIPLEGEKGFEGTPLTRIEKKAVEVRFIIQVTQLESKPKASSIACI